jgi:deoxyribonuclease-4
LGGSFAELRDILALLDGLPADCCVDTAHCFAAGMDIASEQGLEAMLAELDRTVGLARVRVIHANDSRSPLGSPRDWHEHIGRGGIGREGFRRIVNHPALRDKVFILETPIEKPGDDRRNLRVIRSLRVAESKDMNTAAARTMRSRESLPRRRQRAPVGVSRRSKEPAGVLVGV